MREEKNVVFMGTPEFAKIALEELYDSGYSIKACFTNLDKPAGRGMKMKMSPVKEFALEKNIPVYQPLKIRKNQEVLDLLKGMDIDFLVVVAYGKILPKEILEIPKYGAINVHASLLPKYRGAAPIEWAIVNGETKTGITTMFMDEGMDTGDMLLKQEVEITEQDDLATIYEKLEKISGKLLVQTLDGILDGSVVREKQSGAFCLAPMIQKEMTKIDFSKKAHEISCFVRGFAPLHGTYMELQDGRKLKVYKIEAKEKEGNDVLPNGSIVTLSKNTLEIKCADGVISVLEIQPENSRRMDISAFLAGNKLKKEDYFI